VKRSHLFCIFLRLLVSELKAPFGSKQTSKQTKQKVGPDAQ